MISICITGGPSSGKTECIEHIAHALRQDGHTVLVVSEPATELINAGFIPESSSDYLFNEQVMSLHMRNFDVFSKIAAGRSFDVVLYDRGAYDVQAYLTKQEWEQMSAAFELVARSVIPCYYQHVLFLRTSVVLDERNVRSEGTLESVNDILALDRATQKVWEEVTALPIFAPRENKLCKYTEVYDHINGLLNVDGDARSGGSQDT
jgi:thymidylate kinase